MPGMTVAGRETYKNGTRGSGLTGERPVRRLCAAGGSGGHVANGRRTPALPSMRRAELSGMLPAVCCADGMVCPFSAFVLLAFQNGGLLAELA